MPLFEALAQRLHSDGHEIAVTARDHAQTVALARPAFPSVEVIGGASPRGVVRKGLEIGRRALELKGFAHGGRFDVAVSHGSYAQVIAARSLGIHAVTMMDYEHQPANHVSFRAACRVIVPEWFPRTALRSFGATAGKTSTYSGYKEDLYLASAHFDDPSVEALGLADDRVCVVLRPPPAGALYHRTDNERFNQIVNAIISRGDVQGVLLPRDESDRERYAGTPLLVPPFPVHGPSLLARADLLVGAGGTMNREAALLGVPTYTVFAGRLAAADATLIREGRMHDLRVGDLPSLVAKEGRAHARESARRAPRILEVVMHALRV